MKLISYRFDGRDSYGAVVGDRVVDLQEPSGARAPDLKTFIAADLFTQAAAQVAAAQATLPLAEVALQPVIPDPGKIFCIGLNYAEHIRETGKEATEKPVIFLRVADSQLARRMGEAARRMVLERYTWDACARRCLEAYRQLLRSS